MSNLETETRYTCANTPTGGPALYGDEPRLATAAEPGSKAAVADVCWPDPVVRVGFVNKRNDWGDLLRKQVEKIAPIWSRYANITFEFVEGWTDDITINFEEDPENEIVYGTFCSFLGTDSRLYSKSQQASMHLVFDHNSRNNTNDEYQRLILHEFGHALGLIHEHMRPDRPILWNQPAVYSFYNSNYGWNWPMVKAQVIDVYERKVNDQTPFDPQSIMMYEFGRGLATYEDGTPFTTHSNCNLTSGDIDLIARTYPKKSTAK